MKKFVAAAVSAAMIALPSVAMAYSAEDVMNNWSMEPGMTNVTAKTRMSLRLNTLMDARLRMDAMAAKRVMTHNGRPDRRAVQTKKHEDTATHGKSRYTSVKGYRQQRAERLKRLLNGGESSSSMSSASSEAMSSSEASTSSGASSSASSY